MQIPIIQPHKDQKLIINFIKNEEGQDSITFEFEPDFEQPEAPTQVAAMSVANHIIESFGLNKKPEEEGKENE